jgi:hypothetical protein
MDPVVYKIIAFFFDDPVFLRSYPVKKSICLDIMLCSVLEANSCFGSACYLLYAGFLLDLFFSPENRGDMFLQNTG